MSRAQTHERSWQAFAFLLVASLLLLGCSSSALPSGPKGTVTGKVTYNGSPVPAGSTVMFVHEETALPATGQVGADGSFALMMQGESQVLAGSYSVCVTPPASTEVSPDTDMDAYKAMMEGGTGASMPTGPFPQKYNAPETSGVTFEVKEGPNTFELDMKDDA